ncbi:MAG: hypothetical protein GEV06_25700, partial [Luteitalea sp.]|nr:hypothetical protein [Luteitalea sp.]
CERTLAQRTVQDIAYEVGECRIEMLGTCSQLHRLFLVEAHLHHIQRTRSRIRCLARGGMRTYESMRRLEPDLFVHSGDLIYARPT